MVIWSILYNLRKEILLYIGPKNFRDHYVRSKISKYLKKTFLDCSRTVKNSTKVLNHACFSPARCVKYFSLVHDSWIFFILNFSSEHMFPSQKSSSSTNENLKSPKKVGQLFDWRQDTALNRLSQRIKRSSLALNEKASFKPKISLEDIREGSSKKSYTPGAFYVSWF